jgi:1-phosphatidylinositol-3-phosphate 5-kinase
MFHLRIMLRQMLTTESIPNINEWETTLLKLALRIARDLTFTAHPHRQGADMDVRNYVKIKKIPGGAPRDSEFIDGAVITKNVAHKAMSRSQRNPRVMFVTFPLEFHRVEGQYMHFGQIVRQEKEYLNNLATRIAALRPHIVLVESSVSRIALDALAQHKIGVARMVKSSAIAFVARMTQGDVFSSMDKLALEPRLGHCAQFRIQTFDHPLIPGRRKTYMRFEGCNREMGCTILLRGGDIDTLTRIKRVTRFLTFIVRNLKLETHLWKDSVITLPHLTLEATPQSPSTARSMSPFGSVPSALWASFSNLKLFSQLSSDPSDSALVVPNIVDDDDLPDDEVQQRLLSRRIQQSLDPYKKTFISVSATLRFPPPQPIIRMKELDDELINAKRAWEDEVIRREEKAHPKVNFQTSPDHNVGHHVQEITITQGADRGDIKAQIESLPSPLVPRTPTPSSTPHPSMDSALSYFDAKPTSSTLSLGSNLLNIARPGTPSEELPVQMKTRDDIALESQLSHIKWQHEEQRRIWEWYLRKNKDDFIVEKYQCIILWESTVPTVDFGCRGACIPPQMKCITFYGENDCTLGQFIESSVMDTLVQFLDPKAICLAKGCDQPIARHCKIYVHSNIQLMVAVEQWDGQIIGQVNYVPSPELITTWSVCRICGLATPFIPVSEEMQRYSLGKFLELHFYPADVQLVQGAGCQHNIYRHHIRYFAKKGMTLRFQADPVTVHEVVYPPARICVRPETRLELKNADFERLHHRNVMWYTALLDDLKLINIDAATGDEEADLKLTADINVLITRAELEKDEIARLINKVYKDTPPTDTLGLNQVRAYRQDKIVAWQQDFDRLPKPKASQGNDRISRRTSAFGSVRAMWPRRYDLGGTSDIHTSSASVSEAEEFAPPIHRRVTGDSFTSTSSASETSEPELDAKSRVTKKTAESSDKELTVTGEEVSSEQAKIEQTDGDSDSTIGVVREEVIPDDTKSSVLVRSP